MPTARLGLAACSLAATTLMACSAVGSSVPDTHPATATRAVAESQPQPTRVVTLAFAGDVHFQLRAAALLDDPRGLGEMAGALAGADVAMVNLESAITERGSLDPKELEVPAERFWFRTPPSALDFLADAGVDVVTVANNHGADYGPEGLRDTLSAARHAPLAVVGVGRDREAAFAGHRMTVRGTDLAFLAADASPLESSGGVWAAGPRTPGLAAAREPRPRALLEAVRAADREVDVVVVYLHWGRDLRPCPSAAQRSLAGALTSAGADVLVGSHSHVQLGGGWRDGAYVDYGLGNFVWYHDHEPETGVLRLRIEDGEVVSDAWVPGRIGPWGRPSPLVGAEGRRAVSDWEGLRGCAGLGSGPGQSAYDASVSRIGPALRARMAVSHGPGCPTAWSDLRHLRLTYVGFDGRDHTGELVVAAHWARPLLGVFERLHDARWPIRRMRLVDAYGGDDDRSMAADNSSAFNCRRVAGSDSWSDHAYGAAVDLNPVENPYLRGSSVSPPAGARFADLDRGPGESLPRGVIGADDAVVGAFADIGWEWGGTWSVPDYQHFSAPDGAVGG